MVDLGAELAGPHYRPRRRSLDPSPLASAVRAFRPGSAMPTWHSDWAWRHYPSLIVDLSRRFSLKRVCEIGGGRDPLFQPEEARRLGLDLVVNDIDGGELALTPKGLETACFDIAAAPDRLPLAGGSLDMMVSRMVFEHIGDVEAAWRNVHHLLRPGGVGLAFIPTLYAWPYVINAMIPEALSRRLVHALFPNRREGGGDPKFPAHYNHCFGSDEKQRGLLEPLGFSEIVVVPFWGHGYLKRVPLAREIDAAFNRFAALSDWRLFTTYAYVIVRK